MEATARKCRWRQGGRVRRRKSQQTLKASNTISAAAHDSKIYAGSSTWHAADSDAHTVLQKMMKTVKGRAAEGRSSLDFISDDTWPYFLRVRLTGACFVDFDDGGGDAFKNNVRLTIREHEEERSHHWLPCSFVKL